MNKILFTLIAVVLSMVSFISFTGCGGTLFTPMTFDESGSPSTIFEDTKWFLQSYGMQDNLETIIKETEITAIFNSAKYKVSGSAGCNSYEARYEINGSKLSIFEMAFTEMACVSPDGVMEQENVFLSLLANAQSFEADDTTLTIFCSDGQQLYFTTATRLQ